MNPTANTAAAKRSPATPHSRPRAAGAGARGRGRAGWHDRRRLALGLLVRLDALLAPAQPVDQGEQGEQDALHERSRLPITMQVAIRTKVASSQVTIPSGKGPMFPIPHPPRSGGCWVSRT